MNRRTFVSAVSGSLLAAPLIAEAQRATTPRVAFLGNGSAAFSGPLLDSFRAGLRELGHVERQRGHRGALPLPLRADQVIA
jgi:hypothetical protein